MLDFVLPPDPAFVGSAYIQESLPKGNAVGDDDKIYFFFSEAGKEFDFFDNTIVSRIARVCKVSDASVETVCVEGLCFPLQHWTVHMHTHTLLQTTPPAPSTVIYQSGLKSYTFICL